MIRAKNNTGRNAWAIGAATDPGRVRAENQDRIFVDGEQGIFRVVDGVGGHAGGEKAADTACEAIRAELVNNGDGDLKHRIRSAITAANNRICDLAAENEAWRGLACVLALAVMQDDKVMVGHVGDCRLYLIWNGAVRKLNSDHSPVGEREDRGELTETEAMMHPRRHEVFRDVGSHRHQPEDEEFIELKEFLLKKDAAILLCSDGLSDQVTSGEIGSIVECYDGDPEMTAREMVEDANRAGGSSNVTTFFLAGTEFFCACQLSCIPARALSAY